MARIIYIASVILMGAYFAYAEPSKCSCAIFNTNVETVTYVSNDEPKPVALKVPEKLMVAADGQQKCDETCVALALEATEGKPNEAYCKLVQHAEKVLRSLYYRLETGDWRITSLSAKEPICCHEGKTVPCPAA